MARGSVTAAPVVPSAAPIAAPLGSILSVTVMVIGASGLLGRALVPMLLVRDEVRACVRRTEAAEPLRALGAKVEELHRFYHVPASNTAVGHIVLRPVR